ncbi:unnamed protein product (macronuclear) [Paramecium tetraurelia]|uniref:Uncharacterized protein n=1 Tax=Paramecium tetraurelia TaxID=5888 RepID=A0C904_PARTE|nr:uncharacterized protein GSPATT00006577001 [Paramecium tetraurelia]CAK67271.1 unnamed protein product [Paramecium tetraurelia]|eukprot:XP_001434668.1 hypothetical protein (macronuclear) [Paramecium tetraurelia strain d4-2]
MGIVCGQPLKSKSLEFHTSRPLTQSIKQDQENVEFEDQDQCFCPSLTKNYILNPKFLFTEESKCEREEQRLNTDINRNSSLLSLGIQSEPNNLNEIQGKQKNQNKLKPDIQNSKRMSLEQRFKIATSPSQCRKRNNNTPKSPLTAMLQTNNNSTKQKEQLILTKGKRKLSNRDQKLL